MISGFPWRRIETFPALTLISGLVKGMEGMTIGLVQVPIPALAGLGWPGDGKGEGEGEREGDSEGEGEGERGGEGEGEGERAGEGDGEGEREGGGEGEGEGDRGGEGETPDTWKHCGYCLDTLDTWAIMELAMRSGLCPPAGVDRVPSGHAALASTVVGMQFTCP